MKKERAFVFGIKSQSVGKTDVPVIFMTQTIGVPVIFMTPTRCSSNFMTQTIGVIKNKFRMNMFMFWST